MAQRNIVCYKTFSVLDWGVGENIDTKVIQHHIIWGEGFLEETDEKIR